MDGMYYAGIDSDHRSPDDISMFINQILHPNGSNCGSNPVKEGNTASFSENETDEYDSEAFVEELPPEKPRGSSKRSRAAEVHNLSEKRRRNRINEKMKALQNLVPNSNKSNKASMLDEAIEYLKQLQLQVQMLSMRNGISLHPLCLPRLLQPNQYSHFSRGFCDPMSVTDSIPLSQGNAVQTHYDIQSQCTLSNKPSLPNMSTIQNSETSMGIDSSVCARLNPFPLPVTTGEQHLNMDCSPRIPRVKLDKATVLRPFETRASVKDGSSLGAWTTGTDWSECVFSHNIESSTVGLPTSLHGYRAVGVRLDSGLFVV